MTDADGVDWPRIEKLVLSSYTKRGAQATFALMYGLKEGKVTDADKLLAMELQARQAQAELLEKRTIADQLRESLLPMQYDSSVIRFKKQFEVDGKQYAYAAIFAGGRWYITGGAGSRSSYDLDQLILFLASGKVPTRYVTKMVESHSNVASITKTPQVDVRYDKELRIPLIKDEFTQEPPF